MPRVVEGEIMLLAFACVVSRLRCGSREGYEVRLMRRADWRLGWRRRAGVIGGSLLGTGVDDRLGESDKS